MAATIEVDLDLDTEDAAKDAKKKLGKAGNDSGTAFASGFKARLGLIAAAIAGVAAIAKGIDFFKESIAAARVQQDAISNLNTQLSITGQFTEQVSRGLQDFASQLQSTSKFGDEAILGQIAFAQALGATVEQSKQIVTVGADLAESFGIDLNSAVRNVGKTLGGFAGELGEIIPSIKGLTAEQLKAGAGIDLLAKRFQGAAAGALKTFSGSLTSLQNIFGDFQESIGAIVTNSPALISVLNVTSGLISRLTESISGQTNQDLLKPLLLGFVSIARVVNDTVIPAVRILFGLVETGGRIIQTGFQAIITGLATTINNTTGNVLRIIALLPGAVGESAGAAAQVLADIASTAQDTLSDVAGDTFSGLVTPEQTESFRNSVSEIIGEYERAIEASSRFKVVNKESLGEVVKDVSAGAKQIAGVLQGGLTNAFSQSFQNIGQILAGAGNGFKGFVGIVLNALGDLAISLGTTIIASSSAIEALKAAFLGPIGSGVAAIALGGALVAAGAALKVFGSSFGASSPAPSVGGFGNAAGQGIGGGGDQFSQTTPEEREEAQTRVSINIQGDVLDSEDTGLRIARILENAELNNNVRILGGLA